MLVYIAFAESRFVVTFNIRPIFLIISYSVMFVQDKSTISSASGYSSRGKAKRRLAALRDDDDEDDEEDDIFETSRKKPRESAESDAKQKHVKQSFVSKKGQQTFNFTGLGRDESCWF